MKITLIRQGNKEITGYNKENWLPQRITGYHKELLGTTKNYGYH